LFNNLYYQKNFFINIFTYTDEIENLDRIKSEPHSDNKKRNRISMDEYHHDWDKYISNYRKSIYDDEIENLQNQLKELKLIQGNIERDLEYNKKNQQKFKESQNKYIENQNNIKEIDKNINKLLQDIYKLNQLRDNGKDLLDNKVSFKLFNNNVDFKNLQKLPTECK
jgi:DNA repair exonuclease SbcCD ATPase subunit